MRKLLVGLLLLCFCGCSAVQEPSEALRLAQESLHNGMTAQLEIRIPEGEATASLHCQEGRQSLVFESPAVLEGLSFSKSELGVSISMEGLSENLQSGELLQSSAANRLFEALEALSAAEELQPEELPYLEYEGGIFRINWDGSPAQLSCDGLEIHFS